MAEENKTRLSKFFKVLATVWLWLVFLLILISVVGFFIGAPTLQEGWSQVQYTFNPFNFVNYLLILALLLPAVGFNILADKFETTKDKTDIHE